MDRTIAMADRIIARLDAMKPRLEAMHADLTTRLAAMEQHRSGTTFRNVN